MLCSSFYSRMATFVALYVAATPVSDGKYFLRVQAFTLSTPKLVGLLGKASASTNRKSFFHRRRLGGMRVPSLSALCVNTASGSDTQAVENDFEIILPSVDEKKLLNVLQERNKLTPRGKMRAIAITEERAQRSDTKSLARTYLGESNERSKTPTSEHRKFTREEEAELTYRIRALRQVLSVRQQYEAEHGALPTDEEWAASVEPALSVPALRRIVEEGHDARATLVRGNEGLVIRIARRYQNKNIIGSSLSLQDMIQEGKMGLLEAAERFEPERGYKFSTYAPFWIRQRILRCIADYSRAIRLPAHVHAMLHNIVKARKEITDELGRPPSTPELAQFLNIPQDKLKLILESSRHVLSLERPLNGGRGKNDKVDNRVISDRIASDSPTPEDEAEVDFLRRDIRSVIDALRESERDVLVLRFGLDNDTPKTVDETAKRLGVSRERVRLIEARALNKLRHPRRNYKLKEYISVYDSQPTEFGKDRRWHF